MCIEYFFPLNKRLYDAKIDINKFFTFMIFIYLNQIETAPRLYILSETNIPFLLYQTFSF